MGGLVAALPPASSAAASLSPGSPDPARPSSGSGQGLTGAAGDGTMSGSAPTAMNSTNELPSANALSANAAPEHGLVGAGAWPAEYDALVERWDAILARQRDLGARKPK